MSKKRTVHSDAFKAKVALEAVKGVKTMNELSSEYGVHPVLIGQWKKILLSRAGEIFIRGGSGKTKTEDEVTAPLYQEIGRLKVELDWLKKKL
jgi:transposase-like protein